MLEIQEAGKTIGVTRLGLIGFGIAIFCVFYLKLFLSKIFKTRHIDSRGRTLYDAESFDNLNEYVKEKVSSMAGKAIASVVKENMSADLDANQSTRELQNLGDTDRMPYLDTASFMGILNKRMTLTQKEVGEQCVFTIDCVSVET